MAAKKITEEDWRGARRRYESEPGLGYGGVSQALDCSRSLVAKRAQLEQWQKRIGIAESPNRPASDGIPKFTENASVRGVQTARVHSPPHGKEGQPAMAPTSPTIRTPPDLGPVPTMPEGLSWIEQRDWIEKAVLVRQSALNLVQGREIKAAKATVYAAIKAAGGKDSGYDAARTARQVVSALAETHKRESENEAARVRLELGSFEGVRPRPAMIIVHQRPGVSLFGSNDDQAIEARASAADVRARVIEARRIVAAADADISRKGDWEITDV